VNVLKGIRIVTDSTADLDRETLRRYGIHVIPLHIHVNGRSYLDGVDLSPDELLHMMKEADELPKTSQPSFAAFSQIYEKLTKEGYEVLSIHLSGKLSGIIQTARMAAEAFRGKVKVIDSFFISKALSFQVVEAAKLAMERLPMERIIRRMEDIRQKTKLYVVVDTLENLVKGGRIGKGKALLGSLLNIKPIASLEDGVYTPVTNARSHRQAVRHLMETFIRETMGKTVKGIGIVHAEGLELAKSLKEKILERFAHLEIPVEKTTPVISIHTGPGAIGFMYYAE